ncbi:MAG: glycosyltransferase family 39 protein [Acidobacteriota bacterium]|nr:glycosyltransferase family 39 protein [Acidobacteriota bacterium]
MSDAKARRLGVWSLLAGLVAAAAALRLAHVGAVQADPYYDSAVRSMGLSWHNLLFGALEPGATVSLDKPPLDLWPAVLSTKLFGFNPVALRLPQALAGTSAVALLFLALRRAAGSRAGLAAAAALAFMPIEVITARSDTTDSIMMALCTLALYAVVRAARTGSTRWLLAAAAALGLAFNVKLTESWLALPPIALIALLGMPRARPRWVPLTAGAAAYVAVALAWLTFTLLVPAHSQPYAVGSTNGSPWNAAFVFNGLDRLKGTGQIEGPASTGEARRAHPERTQAQRNAIPITPPSAARLLTRVGPLSGERLGIEVLAALLLGLPALAFLAAQARLARRRGDSAQLPAATAQEARVRLAVTAGVALWLGEGIVLFSAMARLHPRYTEAFLPAVAGMLGIGAAWATGPSGTARAIHAIRGEGPARRLILLLTAGAMIGYGEHLLYGTPGIWWIVLAGGLVAGGTGLMALRGAEAGRRSRALRHISFLALMACTLAIPLWASLAAVRENTSDGNVLGALPPAELNALSAYLRAHQGGAHYETAYDSASHMGALVERDARPVLPLSTVEGHMIVSTARLAALARAGEVRYLVLSGSCPRHASAEDASCSAQVAWVRSNGRDVSREAGLPPNTLWALPSAAPARTAAPRGGGALAGTRRGR